MNKPIDRIHDPVHGYGYLVAPVPFVGRWLAVSEATGAAGSDMGTHHVTTRPFIPRPPGEPAWWAQPGKAEEFAAIERERREREVLSGVRGGKDDGH